MSQLELFPTPYKYIIDTSSILSQKDNEKHRRQVYKKMWEKIEDYIENQIIVTCSEIAEEVRDKDIKNWLLTHHCMILEIDDEIQLNLRKIVTEHPRMIDFSEKKGSSSGDAFLIATAIKYNLVIITEENPDKQYKIPQICKHYNIESLSITDFCEKEGWVF